MRGRLLDLGHYPGLSTARAVSGEIYRLDDSELLAVLDRAEGYNFDRRCTIVTLANGRRARRIYRHRGRRERPCSFRTGTHRRKQWR